MILACLTPFFRAATGAALLAAGLLAAGPAFGGGLAELMGHMQRHTHKLQLSVEARNTDLVAFYVHEIEELAEEIRDEIPEYDGKPVGALTGQLLLPAVEALEDPVEAGDWESADARFDALLETCNTCHESTGHGFLRIRRAEGNPFNQDFSPAD